jgi:hypothetical protein
MFVGAVEWDENRRCLSHGSSKASIRSETAPADERSSVACKTNRVSLWENLPSAAGFYWLDTESIATCPMKHERLGVEWDEVVENIQHVHVFILTKLVSHWDLALRRRRSFFCFMGDYAGETWTNSIPWLAYYVRLILEIVSMNDGVFSWNNLHVLFTSLDGNILALINTTRYANPEKADWDTPQ